MVRKSYEEDATKNRKHQDERFDEISDEEGGLKGTKGEEENGNAREKEE